MNSQMQPILLRLTHKRFFPNKHGRSRPDHNPPQHWRVAGQFDLVRFERVEQSTHLALSDMSTPCEFTSSLFAHTITEDDAARLATLLPQICSPDDVQDKKVLPLAMLASVSLVGPAYELLGKAPSAQAALRAVYETIRERITAAKDVPSNFFVLRDLGAADMLLLAFATRPEEIRAFNGIIRALQLSPLRTLASMLRSTQGALAIDDSETKWPGIGFFVLPPLLAFRKNAEKHFEADGFRQAEIDTKIQYRFKLAVEVGHEAEVIRCLKKAARDEIAFVDPRSPDSSTDLLSHDLPWDSHAVIGRYAHFSTFAKLWEEFLFDSRVRRLFILDSVTTPCFPEKWVDPASPIQRWVLTEALERRLQDIRTRFKNLAATSLNKPQGQLLLGVYSFFEGSFLRMDIGVRAIDLLPFFDALAMVLERRTAQLAEEDGRNCDLFTTNKETFSVEFADLMADLDRGLRSRLDDRPVSADRSGTFAMEGASAKTLVAYSGVMSLCSSVLSGGDPANSQPLVSCVSIGADGRVTLREPFKRVSVLPEPLLPKLLCLQIPRNALLEPEIAMIHCCHEIAEAGAWMNRDTCRPLKEMLNTWTAHRLIQQTVKIIADLARGDEKREWSSEKKAQINAFFKGVFWYALVAEVSGKKQGLGSLDNTGQFFDRALRDMNPLAFCDLAIDVMYALTPDICNWFCRDLAATKGPRPTWCKSMRSEQPPEVGLLDLLGKSDDLAFCCRSLTEICREVTADVGMVVAMDQLLEFPKGRNLQRVAAIDRCFQSMVQQMNDVHRLGAPRDRVHRTVVYRWALQAAAASPDDRWVERLKKKLDENSVPTDFLAELLKQHGSWFGPKGVVVRLQLLQPYGGHVVLAEDAVSGKSIDALRAAWKDPSVGLRLALLDELWAVGVRSGCSEPLFLSQDEPPEDATPPRNHELAGSPV